MSANTHAYVALWATCDCVVALCVDETDYPKDIAKEVADYVRRGYRVNRLPLEQVNAMPWRCPEHPKGTPPPWEIRKHKRPVFGEPATP